MLLLCQPVSCNLVPGFSSCGCLTSSGCPMPFGCCAVCREESSQKATRKGKSPQGPAGQRMKKPRLDVENGMVATQLQGAAIRALLANPAPLLRQRGPLMALQHADEVQLVGWEWCIIHRVLAVPVGSIWNYRHGVQVGSESSHATRGPAGAGIRFLSTRVFAAVLGQGAECLLCMAPLI